MSDPVRNGLPELPVSVALDEISRTLGARQALVLEAPPGAGKTTLVPLALLDADWLGSARILMLEPRRMAARAAAERMAALLGETTGERVGYRVRLESRVSSRTRIEVITEGILTRMLQDDPSLPGVGVLVFDEFHERSLDADLGLALALAARTLFREPHDPLRLLVMSATLDGAAVARLLGDAPVVRVEGRTWPVDIRHVASTPARDALIPELLRCLRGVLAEDPIRTGDILVFLPGQAEIARVASELGATPAGTALLPLHGGLGLAEQQRAIAPSSPGQRKLVLATNIAETSLTIEGVGTVVDAGLAREPHYDPGSALTRLRTRRISRAASEQRAGRAGRLRAGTCYRLWSAGEQAMLAAAREPEILQSDLAPLALALLSWGIADPSELAWLDPPPAGAWAQAITLLCEAGAIEAGAGSTWRLTPLGERMAGLPMHPRLSRMLLGATDPSALATACALAALLAERAPPTRSADVGVLLTLLGREAPCPASHRGWAERTRRQAAIYAQSLDGKKRGADAAAIRADLAGELLALAYPDRIARRRPGAHGQYQLANGRSARLAEEDPLALEEWLVAPELGSRSGEGSERIFLAAALSPEVFGDRLAAQVHVEEIAEWSEAEGRFLAERRRRVGAIVLSRERIADLPVARRTEALCRWIAGAGLHVLPWTEELRQWQARVRLLRSLDTATAASSWPAVDDATLIATLPDWLGPALAEVGTRAALQRIALGAALRALLPWPLPRELERLAPERITVPSGSSVAIDYTRTPPVLAVKLQEMFGCSDTPAVALGRVPLLLELLSPAGRPLALTQDLGGFWRGAYADVRKDMRGRYPKHPWPEDPLSAHPTRHTKRRDAGSASA